MTAPVAAAYTGISQSTFWVRFRLIGVKEGGKTFWARAQLDQFIAEQFGLNDPERSEEDWYRTAYDRWKAGQDKR